MHFPGRKTTNVSIPGAGRTADSGHVPAIEMIDVCRGAGIDRLSLVVEQGEIFGLFGPPGSGKTTIINLLRGSMVPRSGKIKVLGYDLANPGRPMQHLFGVASRTDPNIPDEVHTAYEHLRLHANLLGLPAWQHRERITRTLAEVQLASYDNICVQAFSCAMKCRLAIARALLPDSSLLYIDEPTAGIDGQAQQAIWHDLYQIRTSGKTIVLATCDWEEAQTLCNRLAILNRGKLQPFVSSSVGPAGLAWEERYLLPGK
ncbi:MAG: ABC transporter ATP-binding protein [Chloroflexota bacterium]|nr:ABC transporter ATP-binding protein [Chloroflexota bacterium]